MHIDRDKAADLGVQVADVASALRLLVGGLKVSTYEEKGEQYDVRVRADETYRANVDGLALAHGALVALGSVPLLDVVDARARRRARREINRLNRRRQVTVARQRRARQSARARSPTRSTKILDRPHLPAGYAAAPHRPVAARWAARRRASCSPSALSFIFMYLVLAAQFESWLHPITILLSLPLTLPFALISLLLFKQSLNIFSMLGLLVLFGVVKKNSILQIDHTNHLRAAGHASATRRSSTANKDRLRPILMTTLAFVAGMIPLVLSTGIGAASTAPPRASSSAARRSRCCSRCSRRRSPTRCSTTRRPGSSAISARRTPKRAAKTRSTTMSSSWRQRVAALSRANA